MPYFDKLHCKIVWTEEATKTAEKRKIFADEKNSRLIKINGSECIYKHINKCVIYIYIYIYMNKKHVLY